ncbi:MAG: hypothetical protein U1F43_11450 [Myxococcota bacterium]
MAFQPSNEAGAISAVNHEPVVMPVWRPTLRATGSRTMKAWPGWPPMTALAGAMPAESS